MTALTDRHLARRLAELEQRLRAARDHRPSFAQMMREDLAHFMAAMFTPPPPPPSNSNHPRRRAA